MQQTTSDNRLKFHQWLGTTKTLFPKSMVEMPKVPNRLMILNGEVVQIDSQAPTYIGLPDGAEVNIIHHDDLKALIQMVSVMKTWIAMCPIQSASRSGIEDFN